MAAWLAFHVPNFAFPPFPQFPQALCQSAPNSAAAEGGGVSAVSASDPTIRTKRTSQGGGRQPLMPGAAVTLRRKPARTSDGMTCSVLGFVQVGRPPGMAMLLDLVASICK
jgi:hypothetical protein